MIEHIIIQTYIVSFLTSFFMKYTLGLLCVLLFSCTSDKSDEVLIKDLKKASSIIEKENLRTITKVETYYRKDTADATGKALYAKLQLIQTYKAAYRDSIVNKTGAEIQKANAEFVKACVALLTKEEKADVLSEMKDSPLFDSGLLQEIEESTVLPHELSLEAEIFTEELYKVLLKDFTKEVSKGKHKIDWDVIYYEQP